MLNYFKVYGLRRSGNHAIINWIAANRGGHIYYYNDLQRIDCLQIVCDYLPAFETLSDVTSSDFFQKLDTAVISFENRPLDSFPNENDFYLFNLVKRFNNVDVRNIVVIRDYYNLMASIYMCMLNGHDWIRTRGGDISKTNQMSLYWRNYVEHAFAQDNGFHVVDYDRWCDAPDYRDQLARQFNFKYRDRGFDQVSRYGFGSSFHGMTQTARNLTVSERWKTFADDDKFRSYLHQDVIRDQYLRFYGETEAYKYFNK